MIRRCHLDRVLAAVRRSGVHAEVEALLRPTKDGRPRQLSVDVFLTGVILTAMDGRGLSLVNVHKTLTQQIARSAQVAIGTRYRSRGEVSRPISVRQVSYLLDAIERRLAYTTGRAPDLPASDRDVRAGALQQILDHLVQSSVPDHLPAPTSMSLDATALESWAKGTRRPTGSGDSDEDEREDREGAFDEDILDTTVEEGRSFDPDAHWGYRTKTYDNKSNQCFGYDMYALVAVHAVGEPAASVPNLIHRVTLRRGASDVVEPALTMLDSLDAAGRAVSELLADRAWSYKKPHRWADPVRDRGIATVFDIHPNDHKVRDHHGIRMIDGTPHCPAMPDELISIDRPAHLSVGPLKKNATFQDKLNHARAVADLAAFRTAIAERQQWSFRRVAGPDADGRERWECPAQAGKLICEHCPMSALLPEGTPNVTHPPDITIIPDRIDIEDPTPKDPTRTKNVKNPDLLCCRQRTITLGAEVTPKLRQQLYWGSDEWISSFNRRTYVEGYFGNIKNPKTENVRRGWCHVVGIVKTSLLAACAVVATNIRLLRSWSERTGDITDPLCAVDPEDHGFEELDADPETGPGITGPPVPA